MKLVVMTKSTFFVEEDKILEALFEEGMDDLHLFKPNSTPIFSERLLKLIPEEYHKKITVHEHYYLKSEYNLRGIHLDNPSENLPDGYKGKYSRTCTNIDEVKDMRKKSEYVFLKNIFDCIEFPTEKSSFTTEQLIQASRDGIINKSVYALGGICLDNIKFARDLGFGGVVVCGDLWSKFNIQQGNDFKEIIEHFKRLRKAVS